MQSLIVITLALHLLCMNLAGGGPVLCLWLDWREGRGDAAAGVAGRRLASWSLLAFLVGSLLGVALGALLWSDTYYQGLHRLHRKVMFGGIELVFSLVLMGVHWAWWRAKPGTSSSARGLRLFVLFLAASNLLYHFPFLFVILSQVVQESGDAAIDAAAFRGRMASGLVLAESTHFLLACGAVAGLALAWLRRPEEPAGPAKLGGKAALFTSVLQIPVGFWLTLQLPKSGQQVVMGQDPLGTGLFMVSVLFAFAMMHHLAKLAFRDDPGRSRVAALSLMLAVVFAMTGTLRRIKDAATPAPAEAAQSSGGEPLGGS